MPWKKVKDFHREIKVGDKIISSDWNETHPKCLYYDLVIAIGKTLFLSMGPDDDVEESWSINKEEGVYWLVWRERKKSRKP